MTFKTIIPVLLVMGSFGNPIESSVTKSPSTSVVEQCMASVEVVDNFDEYRSELNTCYDNNSND